MVIIGMTGRSGSGKGYICALLDKRGIPSLDTDLVCRLVYEPGQDCYAELVARFGEKILTSDGTIDRRELMTVAFASPEDYADLNSIAHRHILGYCRKWLRDRAEDGCRAAIIDAPLLFESGFDRECDLKVAVIAGDVLRAERLKVRDGIDGETIRKRLAKQKNDDFYLANCDFCVYNDNKNNEELESQLDELEKLILQIEKKEN